MKHILTITTLLILVATFTVGAGRPDSGRQRAKARYYYTLGAKAVAEGKNAVAYEYFKKSCQSDPTYLEAASAFGTQRLSISNPALQDDETLIADLDLMRRFVDAYPEDFHESQYYGYVASQLDSAAEAVRVFTRLDSIYPTRTSTLIHLSRAYMALGEADSALMALDKYETIEGHNPNLTLQKMSILLNEQDTVRTIREIDKLIAAVPGEPTFRVLRGNLMNFLGQPDSALVCFLEAESLAPDNGTAKIALADWYKQHGDSAKYDEKTYEALLSEDFGLEEKTDLLSQYLQMLINDKSDTQRGDHLFEVLSDQYPHEPQILDLGARYLAAKRQYGEAIEQMQYAIDLNQTNSIYWRQLMAFQLMADRYKDVEQTYEKASEHIVPDENISLILASAANLAKDYDLAEATYFDLITKALPGINPADSLADKSRLRSLSYDELVNVSTLFEMLGDSYYSAKKIPEAFRAYENALFLFSDNILALNNYAYFLSEQGGDLVRAEQMSSRAIAADPDNDTYLDTYAWILFKLGRAEEALPYQKTALEKGKEHGEVSAELYSHYGDILFATGDLDGAVEAWQKALEIEPDNELLQKKVKHKTYFEK